MVKSLWASVMGNPRIMQKANGWLTVFWISMIPLSMAMGWLKSVVYVSALSLWALVSGHLSTWQAARVEVKQDEATAGPTDRHAAPWTQVRAVRRRRRHTVR
jgi:hypothetical protein